MDRDLALLLESGGLWVGRPLVLVTLTHATLLLLCCKFGNGQLSMGSSSFPLVYGLKRLNKGSTPPYNSLVPEVQGSDMLAE